MDSITEVSHTLEAKAEHSNKISGIFADRVKLGGDMNVKLIYKSTNENKQ